MSKLGCRCGRTIYDQTDHLAYKGTILRDQHASVKIDAVADAIAGYIRARIAQNEKEWLIDRFADAFTDSNENDAEVVYALISGLFSPGLALEIYQCEHCQRVLIEDHQQSNRFFSFAPEDEKAVGILNV